MRHHFQTEQWLPYRVELVFSFFANPENLPRLMPSWQKARIEQASFTAPPPRPLTVGPQPPAGGVAAGVGTRMTLSFRPFPFSPLRASWDAKISEFLWNDYFCDIQLRGPFTYWRHCHRLQDETRIGKDGHSIAGSLLQDSVEYEVPLGIFGEIARRLFIERQLQSTFHYRQRRTEELLSLMA